MPVEIRVPPLGESLVDAVVGQWLKSEGDSVSRGETLVELETDKVNLDVAAALADTAELHPREVVHALGAAVLDATGGDLRARRGAERS